MTNTTRRKSPANVGVDIGKLISDVYRHEKHCHFQTGNNETGIKRLFT